jgi:hypothetical protein
VATTPTIDIPKISGAETADGVVPLDHREPGEVSVDRLVHVPHGGLESGELGIRLE